MEVFAQTYRSLVFHEALIVAAKRNEKHQTLDALEAMDPFLPLRALAANVKHMVSQLAKLKDSLSDSGRSET